MLGEADVLPKEQQTNSIYYSCAFFLNKDNLFLPEIL